MYDVPVTFFSVIALFVMVGYKLVSVVFGNEYKTVVEVTNG